MLIETSRLRLRPLNQADADGYGELLADPGVHPYVVENGPVGREAIPERIRSKQAQFERGSAATLAVLIDGRFIGYVALHGLGATKVAISYAICHEAQRQGYGAEAVESVLCHAGYFGFRDVEARTHHGNEASAGLLLSLGFEEQAPDVEPPRRVFVWRTNPTR